MASGVRIEKWFKQGFSLYMGSAGVLILASLLAFLVSLFTLGILAGPMLAGMLMIGLRLHDKSEPAPEVGDLFKGFEYFKDAFLLALSAFILMFLVGLVLNFIPVIGNILFYAILSLVYLVVWFAMGRVVEEGKDFWPAAQEAIEKIKPNLWLFLAYAVLVMLAGGVGSIACGVGVCLTMPLLVCSVATAYRDTWSDPSGEEEAEPPPAAPEGEPADNPTTGVEIVETDPEQGEAAEGGEGEEKPPAAG